MHFAVYGKAIGEENVAFVSSVFRILSLSHIRMSIYSVYLDRIKELVNLGNFDFEVIEEDADLKELGVDFLLSLGGDGTILTVALLAMEAQIPILGVNLGRLGFLASIEEQSFRIAIDKILNGLYEIETRTMLEVESNLPLFGNNPYALNDFTLTKRDTSAMIVIHTYVDDEFLNSYWADGIIVATPTGSTGYSLSCGGPILDPRANSLVLTPVSPHNLNVRPMVLPNLSRIRFEIEGRAENFLCSLDSRYEVVTHDYVIKVAISEKVTRLVKFDNFSFIQTIRKKMHWGSDSRNSYRHR